MARLKIDADLDALKGGKSARAVQFGFPGQSWVGHTPCWRRVLWFLLSTVHNGSYLYVSVWFPMSMCLGCPVPVLRERQQLLVPVWWVLLWLCHHLLNLPSIEEHGAISKVLLLNTTNIINFM